MLTRVAFAGLRYFAVEGPDGTRNHTMVKSADIVGSSGDLAGKCRDGKT
jgi:hypothetical protein